MLLGVQVPDVHPGAREPTVYKARWHQEAEGGVDMRGDIAEQYAKDGPSQHAIRQVIPC